jgi:hypothetical protein
VISLFLWVCSCTRGDSKYILFGSFLYVYRFSGCRSLHAVAPLHALAHVQKKYFLFVFYYVIELKIQSDRFYICVSKIFYRTRPFMLYISNNNNNLFNHMYLCTKSTKHCMYQRISIHTSNQTNISCMNSIRFSSS